MKGLYKYKQELQYCPSLFILIFQYFKGQKLHQISHIQQNKFYKILDHNRSVHAYWKLLNRVFLYIQTTSTLNYIQLPLRISQHRPIYIFLKIDIKNTSHTYAALQCSNLALSVLMIYCVNTIFLKYILINLKGQPCLQIKALILFKASEWAFALAQHDFYKALKKLIQHHIKGF